MSEMDDLINRLATSVVKGDEFAVKKDDLTDSLSRAREAMTEIYRCESDGYTIWRDPLTGQSEYQFDGEHSPLHQRVTSEQKSQYLSTGYWSNL